MSLHAYSRILTHSARIEPFARALATAVSPESRVLDVGTGLGTYALFAARSGARRVVALDDDDVIHLARELARVNGVGDEVEFVQGRAPEAVPAGRFDVIVFEDYPTTLLDAPTWRLMSALCSTHLDTGGVVIPGAGRLVLAPVTDPRWALPPERARRTPGLAGLDWSPLRAALANLGRQVSLPEEALAGEPRPGRSLSLAPPPPGRELSVEGDWPAPGEPVVALAVWMELEVLPGEWISNRPSPSTEPWGQWLLPVDPPLAVPAGARLHARVWREELDDGTPGWMGWRCRAGTEERRGHEFAGLPLSPDAVHPR